MYKILLLLFSYLISIIFNNNCCQTWIHNLITQILPIIQILGIRVRETEVVAGSLRHKIVAVIKVEQIRIIGDLSSRETVRNIVLRIKISRQILDGDLKIVLMLVMELILALNHALKTETEIETETGHKIQKIHAQVSPKPWKIHTLKIQETEQTIQTPISLPEIETGIEIDDLKISRQWITETVRFDKRRADHVHEIIISRKINRNLKKPLRN